MSEDGCVRVTGGLIGQFLFFLRDFFPDPGPPPLPAATDGLLWLITTCPSCNSYSHTHISYSHTSLMGKMQIAHCIPVFQYCHQPSFECPSKTWHPSPGPVIPSPPVAIKLRLTKAQITRHDLTLDKQILFWYVRKLVGEHVSIFEHNIHPLCMVYGKITLL